MFWHGNRNIETQTSKIINTMDLAIKCQLAGGGNPVMVDNKGWSVVNKIRELLQFN